MHTYSQEWVDEVERRIREHLSWDKWSYPLNTLLKVKRVLRKRAKKEQKWKREEEERSGFYSNLRCSTSPEQQAKKPE